MRAAGIDLRTIVRRVEQDFGDVAGLAQLPHGEESVAYRFRSDACDLVLRVGPNADGFTKDAFAQHRFGRAELPIPRVLQIGQVDTMSYCVSEYLPGATLQDLAPEDLARVLTSTADALRAVSNSDTGALAGFGPFDATGTGEYRSWREFLSSIAEPAFYDWKSMAGVVDRDQANRALECLLATLRHCPERRDLIHGDFGSNNVLTDGSVITGVLDWSDAMIGDRMYDVANVLFWRTWLTCMEQQARYFEAREGWEKIDAERLTCYQLRIGLEEVYRSAADGNGAMARWALDRCRDIVYGSALR
jgi:hygromycin-B 4-O-kinase